MKSFYECSFFDQRLALKGQKNLDFVVTQEEIHLSGKAGVNNFSFSKKTIDYRCSYVKGDRFDHSKPTIIIPIKDNVTLLKITIQNLSQRKVLESCNLFVVDDRTCNNEIKDATIQVGASYIKVDNNKGFNFSMLNNIASKVVHELGCETIIFWNSDLWTPDEETVPQLLLKHKLSGSTLSGTKLIYPPIEFSLNGEADSENIISNFPSMTKGRWRNTVQFGGTAFRGTEPYHVYRFRQSSDPRVNCETGCNMITGAFQIWDLPRFIEIGGFNPSLSKNYQDNDVCLRLLERNLIPMYFGKDLFLFHDESPSLMKEGKQDRQIYSDHVLFHKLWDQKLLTLF